MKTKPTTYFISRYSLPENTTTMEQLSAIHPLARCYQKDSKSALTINNGIEVADTSHSGPTDLNATVIRSLLACPYLFVFIALSLAFLLVEETHILFFMVQFAPGLREEKAFVLGIVIALYIGWAIFFHLIRMVIRDSLISMAALSFFSVCVPLSVLQNPWEDYFWLMLALEIGFNVWLFCLARRYLTNNRLRILMHERKTTK